MVLGSVTLTAPEELRRVMARGVLAGVEVPALADLGRYGEFWAAAEETGAVVFIHPTTRGFDVPALRDYYLWNSVGNPLETTITAANMVMAGVLERHPGLKVVLAHAGGALLALRGRLRHAHRFVPAASARLVEPPEESLWLFHYDTLTHDRDLLLALIEYVGAQQVVLGSDYPFDMGEQRPAATVRECGLGPAAERAILEDNALRLLEGGKGAMV